MLTLWFKTPGPNMRTPSRSRTELLDPSHAMRYLHLTSRRRPFTRSPICAVIPSHVWSKPNSSVPNSNCMPCWESRIECHRPAGPAPTSRTGSSSTRPGLTPKRPDGRAARHRPVAAVPGGWAGWIGWPEPEARFRAWLAGSTCRRSDRLPRTLLRVHHRLSSTSLLLLQVNGPTVTFGDVPGIGRSTEAGTESQY